MYSVISSICKWKGTVEWPLQKRQEDMCERVNTIQEEGGGLICRGLLAIWQF
jgi:hypothetical protein